MERCTNADPKPYWTPQRHYADCTTAANWLAVHPCRKCSADSKYITVEYHGCDPTELIPWCKECILNDAEAKTDKILSDMQSMEKLREEMSERNRRKREALEKAAAVLSESELSILRWN